jgi:protein SCO1/2
MRHDCDVFGRNVMMLAVAATLACASAPPVVAPVAARGSLFDRGWDWRDEQGTALRFSRWRGSPLVVSLVYTTCTMTCPVTIEKLLKIEGELQRQGRRAEFVLVTIDPSNDTVEALRRFKAARGLPASWHLLRGDDEQTQQLADFLGFKMMNMDDHIIHDVNVAFIDPQGRLVGQSPG